MARSNPKELSKEHVPVCDGGGVLGVDVSGCSTALIRFLMHASVVCVGDKVPFLKGSRHRVATDLPVEGCLLFQCEKPIVFLFKLELFDQPKQTVYSSVCNAPLPVTKLLSYSPRIHISSAELVPL